MTDAPRAAEAHACSPPPMSAAQAEAALVELRDALRADNEAYFCGLLRRAWDRPMESAARERMESGFPALMLLACEAGCAQSLWELLRRTPDAQLSARAAELYAMAIIERAPECVRLLAERVDPAHVFIGPRRALSFAATHGCLSAAKLLLPRSDPMALNEDGTDALFAAASRDHVDIVRFLAPHCRLRPLADGCDALDAALGEGFWETADALTPLAARARLESVAQMASAQLGESWPERMPQTRAAIEQSQLRAASGLDAPAAAPASAQSPAEAQPRASAAREARRI